VAYEREAQIILFLELEVAASVVVAMKLWANALRWCASYENHQGLVLQVLGEEDCTQTVWRYASRCFRRGSRKNCAMRSRQTPVNSRVKHQANSMYHTRQCTGHSISGRICFHNKCGIPSNWSGTSQNS
jgi:hypothetical protein